MILFLESSTVSACVHVTNCPDAVVCRRKHTNQDVRILYQRESLWAKRNVVTR